MSKSNQDRKRIGKTGWLPFWNGNKFNKRLMSKRVRQYNKAADEFEEWCVNHPIVLSDYSSNIYSKRNYKLNLDIDTHVARDSEEE